VIIRALVLIVLSAFSLTGCRNEQEVAPSFDYAWSQACGNAILLSSNVHSTETLVVEFDSSKVGPVFGHAKVIDLPDSLVDVHVVIASGDARPTCGDVFSGDPGFAVQWKAVAGRLTLISAAVPDDWVMAHIEYFVSAELRDLSLQGPAGQIITAPRPLLVFGIAGLGPGP